MNTPRIERQRHYPRPSTPDDRLSHRDIALLNELHDLRLAVDRLTKVVDLKVGLTATSVSALVEQGEYR